MGGGQQEIAVTLLRAAAPVRKCNNRSLWKYRTVRHLQLSAVVRIGGEISVFMNYRSTWGSSVYGRIPQRFISEILCKKKTGNTHRKI